MPPTKTAPPRPHQLPLALLAAAAPRLADGMVGRNEAALASLRQLVQPQPGLARPDDREPWLLLWGEPGAGKTFWLQAWAHALEDQRPGLQVLGSSAGTHDFAQQAQGPLLLIDDIDQWSGPAQQALFAHLAQQAHLPKGRMQPLVLTSQGPAARLQGLREDLRTRLGLALSFELHRLSEPDMIQAMRQQAHGLGWMAQPQQTDYDRLFEYLVTRLPRHLGLLKALMKKVDERALAEKRSITLPLVRSLMDDLLNQTQTSL